MGWVIGATLSILGSIASNLGVNIQKYSFIRQAQRDPTQRTSHWKDVYWLFGLGLVIFGSLGDFAALSMVAQSIVAPLASTTLVTNVIFAHFWLHERVGKRELIGTALIITGSTLAVVFGDHTAKTYTDDALVDLIGGGWFLVYAILVVILCIAGLALHRKITPIKKRLVDAIRRYELAVEANNSEQADAEDEAIARLEKEYKRWEKLHPFSLCALSGAFGAQSVLFGKVFAELLSTTIAGDNQMFHFLPYVALICMGITVTTQLHFLAIALNYFDALYAVPVFQCFFIGVSTLGGALYFREVYDFTVGEAFAFVIGLGLTLGGVAVLSTRRMSQRNVVHHVAGDAAGAVARESEPLVPLAGQSLSDSVIPEGDEEAGDLEYGQQTSLLGRRGSTIRSSSFNSPTSSGTVATPSSTLDDRERTRGQEFEMADYSAKRGSTTGTLPILKSSAMLPNFSEKAEAESKEISDLTNTMEATQSELAAKLAQLSTHAPAVTPVLSSATAPIEIPLLQPTAPSSISPAMAIQIEADQAFINRQDNKSGISGVPVSLAGRKIKQALATRYDTDLEIMKLQSEGGGSPRLTGRSGSFEGAVPGMGTSSGSSSRAETPRSSYVQERERAASVASANPSASGNSSGRNSPAAGTGSGGTTPRRSVEPDSPSLTGAAEPPTTFAPGHVRNLSGLPTPKVRMPSAMFSGAMLESAQDLPDVESDDRIQRLTRLSTVSHWVGGLNAQMPVVGGVVQAILQAKELQSLMDQENSKLQPATNSPSQAPAPAPTTPSDEVKKSGDDVKIDIPFLPPGIELTDIKPVVFNPSESGSGSKKSSPALKPQDSATGSSVPVDESTSSTALSSAAITSSPAPTTISTPPTAPSTKPINRIIQFDEDYDPFSTQSSTKLLHRDPFLRSPSSEDLLASPTSAFAALRRDSSLLSSAPISAPDELHQEEELAAVVEAANARASEKILFSPLHLTHHHPLEEGAQPSPAPPKTPTSANLPSSSSPPSNLPLSPSSLVPPDASIDEWAAALRIQSLYRGRQIRRSLRESGQLTAAQIAQLHQHPNDYDENHTYEAVDPVPIPEFASADPPTTTTTEEQSPNENELTIDSLKRYSSLHPAEIDQDDWQQLQNEVHQAEEKRKLEKQAQGLGDDDDDDDEEEDEQESSGEQINLQ